MEANGQKETEKPSLINISLENLGTVNKNQVIIKNGNKTLSLYFSYNTIVGFNLQILNIEHKQMTESFYKKGVINNLWGNTTGKLLNELEKNKKARLNQIEFNKQLNESINTFFK